MSKKYNEMMNELHLSDAQKEDILQAVLEKSTTKQAKKPFLWKPILAFTIVGLFVLTVFPRGMSGTSSEPSMVEEVEESVEMEEDVSFHSMVLDEDIIYETEEFSAFYTVEESEEENQITWLNDQEVVVIRDGYQYQIHFNQPVEENKKEEWIEEILQP